MSEPNSAGEQQVARPSVSDAPGRPNQVVGQATATTISGLKWISLIMLIIRGQRCIIKAAACFRISGSCLKGSGELNYRPPEEKWAGQVISITIGSPGNYAAAEGAKKQRVKQIDSIAAG